MNAADHHFWESQWTQAALAYQQALAEFPDDSTAHSGLGFCYMQMKQWQEALREYETILQADQGNVIALSKIAELYSILNQREDAYQAYLRLADLYALNGPAERAEAAWQKAVQLSPDNPEPHERLISYYLAKKDIAQMVQEHLAAARNYLARGELSPAYTHCQDVLRADNTNVQAQQLLMAINERATERTQGNSSDQMADMTQSVQAALNNQSHADNVPLGNTSGGNTGIMGNMGSAGNFGGGGNPGAASPFVGNANGMNSAPRGRITANQVTEALQQAQTFQNQGRFNDAIELCEQILSRGLERPDDRYFLSWLYQEQQRWDDAIQQFQLLLNDPDYALSCYYALGQCYRARGDLRTATINFDEAVDRVNLDALTMEESDQLVQLCQEAAEAHRLLGEQEQALTVYNALLGFLRSRGWNEKVAQVEYMLQQAQGTAPEEATARPITPPPVTTTDAPTMEMNAPAINAAANAQNNGSAQQKEPTGELPDWLTGILNDADKSLPGKPAVSSPGMAAPVPSDITTPPVAPSAPSQPVQPQADVPNWLTDDSKPNTTARLSEDSLPPPVPASPQRPPAARVTPPEMPAIPQTSVVQEPQAPQATTYPAQSPAPTFEQSNGQESQLMLPGTSQAEQEHRPGVEELLNQIAGNSENNLSQVAEAVLTSTASLPEGVRLQVVRSMQDIQKYVNHGLLTPATEECLRVIDIAPQYLDVHQILCEIYVRQGKIEQAVTKYGILVDTYVVNGRIDDAVATYRRILQLEPNNLTYRMRLIDLLSSQGHKEDLLRERTLAAEAYLRLGYMDRAMTELEQALKESPTSVPTRLNYALALQKLGRTQQAVAEYQRVLQIDPRNLTALVRWHIAMITTLDTPRATSLELFSRIRWQLRGGGQKHVDGVLREYNKAADISPNNADINFALGQVYQQCGQFDRAVDEYTLAMRDNAVELLARVSLARTFLAQGRPESAIQQLEQSLQIVRHTPNAIDPTTWAARPREDGEEHQAPDKEIALQLAQAYGRTGRQEQMQEIMRQLKRGRPGQDDIVPSISDTYEPQGDLSSALNEQMELVQHYRQNHQIDNALHVLDEVVRLAPQDERAHEALADIYVNRGLLEEGMAELRNGQLEKAGEAIQRVGNIYAEMNNPEEALINLKRATELNPDSMDLMREVVGFCLQLGRNQDAAKYQAIIARHYFETQQIKEAVAALQQLITIDRTNYDAYDMLGQTYQSVGEYEQASRVYRNLAKVNPGNSTARERLATLQELRTR